MFKIYDFGEKRIFLGQKLKKLKVKSRIMCKIIYFNGLGYNED